MNPKDNLDTFDETDNDDEDLPTILEPEEPIRESESERRDCKRMLSDWLNCDYPIPVPKSEEEKQQWISEEEADFWETTIRCYRFISGLRRKVQNNPDIVADDIGRAIDGAWLSFHRALEQETWRRLKSLGASGPLAKWETMSDWVKDVGPARGKELSVYLIRHSTIIPFSGEIRSILASGSP